MLNMHSLNGKSVPQTRQICRQKLMHTLIFAGVAMNSKLKHVKRNSQALLFLFRFSLSTSRERRDVSVKNAKWWHENSVCKQAAE